MPQPGRFALPAVVLALLGATLVPLWSQSQRPPDRNTARTSAISGVVTDGATGRGLTSVVVSFSGAGASQRTVTDSKGRFVFRNLPAVEAGYLDAEKEGYLAGGLTRRNSSFARTPIALAENEWIADVNIPLFRPGSISGIVLDETREPVVDVPVRVLVSAPVAGNVYWATGPVARTDDRGFYRIAGLAGGSYIVNVPSVQSVVPADTSQATIQGKPSNGIFPLALSPMPAIDFGKNWLVLGQYATPPPGGRETYPPIFYPNSRTFRTATVVDLTNSEDRRNIDFVLQPVPAVRLSGRIVGPPEGVPGLVVRLLQDGAEAHGSAAEQATALVAPDGTFTLVNVPAGAYLLEANAGFAEFTTAPSSFMPATPGLVAQTTSFNFLPTTVAGDAVLGGGIRTRRLAGAGSSSARLRLDVGSDDVANIVLRLDRGSTIGGRVIREDGSALPATMSVSVQPANGDPALAAAAADREVGRKPDGSFAVSGLDPGQYLIRAGGLVKSVTIGGLDFTHRPIEVTPGGDVSEVVVTLASQPASLSGNVRTTQGAAVREAAVIVFPVERSQWTNFGMDPSRIRSVTYFGNRKYEVPRLPAGDYYAIAVDQPMRDAWLDPKFFPAASSIATRVTLTWGKPALQDLVLQRVNLR